jgi:hypothetical protein
MNQKIVSIAALLFNISVVYALVTLKPIGVGELNLFSYFADEVRDTMLFDVVAFFGGRHDGLYLWYGVSFVLIGVAWKLRLHTTRLIHIILEKI